MTTMYDDPPDPGLRGDVLRPLPSEAAAVGWGFVAAYTACYTGLWMALLSPLLVGLTLRVDAIDPTHAAGSLSLVTSVGALLALVANPFFGQLSDRTTSRFGMRRSWLIAGALGGLAGLAMVARAVSIPQLLVGWCVVQLAYNAQLAALVAVLSDQVPERQRGTVSGVTGISTPVGMVLGTFLVQQFADSTFIMFVLPGALAAASTLYFAWMLPDRKLTAVVRPRYAWRDFLGGFWLDPRRFPDFGWVWCSRFLFYGGAAVVLTYQALYVVAQLGCATSEVPHLILLSTLVQSGAQVVFSGVGGRWSDAIGRRKVFVAGAALIYALALLALAFAASRGWLLVGMALIGAGQGLYTGVDLALVTDILPQRESHAARNLGIFNIAAVLPQFLMPALAPAVLDASNGSYTVLFMLCTGLVTLSAWAIRPVRGAR
jgi:MFS family permease